MSAVWFAGIAVLIALSGSSALAQRQGGMVPPPVLPSSPNRVPIGGVNPMGPMGTTPMDASGAPDILNARIAEQQARARNSDRQKRIMVDTEKLVGLVDELHQQVQGDKELSPADISKRAEEIEKLARSVKDKMRG
ncbi:hypothetical protein JAO29_07145 [Edaphobacter sp. HDX4]|uniref:hypothetical protein n=1 Tax=Edaphobacter sp. HDX4 TaxID=2794064 RepID=UPI002FE68D65